MAGEMPGLDGIGSGKHVSDASALSDSDICVVPYERLETVSQAAQAMQRYLYRVLSQEIVRKQSMMVLLGSMRRPAARRISVESVATLYCAGFLGIRFPPSH